MGMPGQTGGLKNPHALATRRDFVFREIPATGERTTEIPQ